MQNRIFVHVEWQGESVCIFNDFFYGLTQRNFVARVRCTDCNVTSLSFNKEVTKKVNSAVASEASLRLPLFKANRGERHIYLHVTLAVWPPRVAGRESKSVFA